MKKLYFRWVGIACSLFLITSCISGKGGLQSGFVYAQEKIPGLALDLRYFGAHNFTGRPVEGYERPVLILSRKAVHALKKVQKDLRKKGLALKVFDAYRPQKAVNSFEAWANDANDTIAKAEFYPDVDKHDLFRLGYLAAKSGHTRGSTVDLTLIDIQTGKELDMGSAFDLFGEISHQDTDRITELQKKNRQILRQAMLDHHFKDYHEEWWHFTLIDEPFPDTYFDFPVN